MPNLQVKAERGCKKLNTKCLYDTSIHQPNENLIISYHAFFFFFFFHQSLSEKITLADSLPSLSSYKGSICKANILLQHLSNR